jgi:hypothetical protein
MRYWPLLLLVLARDARAHSVPIDPSLCTFDPVDITAPAIGFEASAAPPGPDDVFRIIYDPGASAAQFCAADPADPANRCASVTPERTFSGGGVSGTLLVSPFQARVLASGDVLAAAVAISFTVDGVTADTSFPLTTGLVAVGVDVAAGAPLAADGSVTLVGTGLAGALPAPFGGASLLVRMHCTAAPPPDLDQFLSPTETTSLAGKIAADRVRLRAAFRAGAEAGAPDFTAAALLRLSAGDTAIAVLALPGGLQAEGKRKFVGRSADGQRVVVRRVRGVRYRMKLRLASATLPAAGGPAAVELVWQAGGLLSRATRTFHPGRAGLHAP